MNRREFIKLGTSALAATSVARAPRAARAETRGTRPLVDEALRKALLAYLADLNAWVMTLDVGSGTLKNTKDTRTSVFINGNFARMLMASYRITGNKAHLAEALRWCDTFCKKQQMTTTSTGQEAGYWPDCGPRGNIYFGDAGTAATALAVGHRFADKQRQARYLAAMERKARFVMHGCAEAPEGRGRKASTGWVIQQGKDRGALGCGYYKGKLSPEPYTISTATTGGAFFSELFAITGQPKYKEIAAGATRWLVKIRKEDGELPYTLAGKTLTCWPLDTLSYCTEAFVAADMYLKDPGLQDLLRKKLKPTVRWFLAGQNADGSWGKLRSADQQRSPRSLTLLSWFYRHVDPSPEAAESVRKYCRFLLNPENSKAYGVKTLVRTSGFVGLAVAEIVSDRSTF